jgi:hypothetical protein
MTGLRTPFARDRIDAEIAEHKAKLVIIEPLVAFLTGIDANKEIHGAIQAEQDCRAAYSCPSPHGLLPLPLVAIDAWSPSLGASGWPLQP